VQTWRATRARHSWQAPSAWFDPALAVLALSQLPWAPFAAVFLLAACLVTLAMVGSLCARHWWFAADGSTYVGSMKGEHIVRGGALQRVHGGEIARAVLHLVLLLGLFHVLPGLGAAATAGWVHAEVCCRDQHGWHRAGVKENLQYVFGAVHPIYWLLPSFRSAPQRHKVNKGA
jgi:hypothetical protein